jgi:hypothetical protein
MEVKEKQKHVQKPRDAIRADPEITYIVFFNTAKYWYKNGEATRQTPKT